MRSNKTPPIDGLALAGLFLMGIMLLNVLAGNSTRIDAAAAQGDAVAPAQETSVEEEDAPSDAIIAPYDSYVVTQGLHGYSYGHAAVDLSAGKGAGIKSPIAGEVKELYVDNLGNPTVVIENPRYRVTLLHGLYSVSAGDQVSLGEVIGVESNQGYTTDFRGRLCAGRDCGYHTHLNVFDRSLGANVNPLDVFNR